jgi:hypothetical protein
LGQGTPAKDSNPNSMKAIYPILIVSGLMTLASCQKQSVALTDEERKLIVDSTTQIIKESIDESSKHFKKIDSSITLLRRYNSADPDVRHIGHGVLFTSLNQLIDSMLTEGNVKFKETVEIFEEKPDRIDVQVLSREIVSITVPCQWKMKVIGLREYNGKEVMSFIMQKRKGKWMIVQSHISDPNLCEAIAALTPPNTDK